MKCALILVDFDNYACLNDVPGQIVKQVHVDMAIEQLVLWVVEWFFRNAPHVAEFYFRFYGGWYTAWSVESITDRAKMIERCIYNAKRIIRKRRVKMEVAYGIMPSDVIFTATLQERRSRIQLPKKNMKDCAFGDACLSRSFMKWQDEGCSGCGIDNSAVMSSVTQKAVDTSMVVDVMSAAIDRAYDKICVVSGDYDMLPGIVFAAEAGAQVVVFRRSDELESDHLVEGCTFVGGLMPVYKMGRR